MVLYPEYYKKFNCIAHRCKHNCCIGWEIDIDDRTLDFYNSVDGDFGERLRQSIYQEGAPHFKLKANDRCPFLNDNGLCDIITTLGEDALCQICNDHPRFRNDYSTFFEIGLGLCCEEAARIILTFEKPFSLISKEGEPLVTKEEAAFFSFRQSLIDLAQEETLSFEEKLKKFEDTYDYKFLRRDILGWVDFLSQLERLDPAWEKYLTLAQVQSEKLNAVDLSSYEKYFSRLLVYFIYRHTADGLYDGKFTQRAALSFYCTYLIRLLTAVQLTHNENFAIENFIELCRSFSAEIEYSEENTESILSL